MCCGTKRLTEIACPADCVYLASAREHPPAAALRQQQRDVTQMMHALRDFNDRQAQLFLVLNTVVARYQAPELQPVHGEDVIHAAAALAATFETASRGVIYDHPAPSIPAERLVAALRPVLQEGGASGGSAFERDAAVALRRIEEAARTAQAADPGNPRAYLDLLDRMLLRAPGVDSDADAAQKREETRLIVP